MDYYALIIHAVIGVLAATVKNPTSSRAKRLREYVVQLAEACEHFLAATDPKKT